MKIIELTDEEISLCMDTLHDSSLQNEQNKFWFVCFDTEIEKQVWAEATKRFLKDEINRTQ